MKVRGIAHRGDPIRYPENTLSAFQAACDLSFTHLELDVHLSKDGVPVVIHDRTINRMCNGTGLIKDYTVHELKQFRIGETETIPTLEEALRLLKGKLIVSIELKQEGNLYEGLEQAVIDVVRKLDMMDEVYVISFDHFSLATLRSLCTEIPIGLVIHGSMPYVFPFMREIRATYLAVRMSFLTDAYAQMIEEEGIQLIAWPIDTPEEMKLVTDRYPTSLICTNYLERWKSHLKELQHHNV
jgi:glycerophosphoryl diester phosphodiesterase